METSIWNGIAGRAWAESQDLLDQVFRPIEELLVARARGRVLDVGCGGGAVTLAVAKRLGAGTGVDISEPMLAVARARAERDRIPAAFVLADAQTHAFAPATFDTILSRFGVMFFEDATAAFTNLRRAAAADASLHAAVWRSAEDNPFMTTAERAAAPLLPNIPPRIPNGPGQFGFADPDRVRGILEGSQWSAIDIQPLDVTCTFAETDLVRYMTRLGPLGRVIDEADDATRGRVVEIVRAAFEPYVHGPEVRFTAACWMANATSR